MKKTTEPSQVTGKSSLTDHIFSHLCQYGAEGEKPSITPDIWTYLVGEPAWAIVDPELTLLAACFGIRGTSSRSRRYSGAHLFIVS